MDLPGYFGKYLLVHQLGRGGMAELFLAKQTGLKGFEKVLAIKKILPHLTQDPEFVSMFVNEGKLAALLTHQHIVQIFDLGHVDGTYYMAMEYVMGKDVRSLINKIRERAGRLPLDHALLIVSQVASGLDYAHRKKDLQGRELNIVHRDVSPQNILVSYEGEVKLVDFGIAKAAGSGQETQTGILKGKLAYMSPEQACGKPIDRRSDVFSLGIVLYELLTDRRLFKGDSDLSTLEQVRTAQVEPPSRFSSEIPPDLEEVVLRALAREPGQRYQTAAEFQAALEQVLAERGQASSSLHLSQYLATVFADELRRDADRFQAAHQETIRLGPGASVASPASPAHRQDKARIVSTPKLAVPPRPSTRRGLGPAIAAAVALFALGGLSVVYSPALLRWMRTQPTEVRALGSAIETQLRTIGLARLTPRPEAPPAVSSFPVPSEVEPVVAASISGAPLLSQPTASASVPQTRESPSAPSPVASAAPSNEDVQPLLHRAKQLYAQGRLDAVEETLRRVIERAPNSPVAYHLLGTVYLEREDEERAFKIFSEAAHQFPRHPALRYDLGFLYAQRGLQSLAREELSRALALQPDGALASRARVFLRTGTFVRPSGPPLPIAETSEPGGDPRPPAVRDAGRLREADPIPADVGTIPRGMTPEGESLSVESDSP